ncbi:MAG: 50S ribosomal protein L25 [Patescibacteria group bacterium]
MIKHTLKADLRKILGRKVKSLRKQGLIPAVVYGKKTKTVNLQIEAKVFGKLHSQVGESALVYLQIEGEKEERPVLIRQVTLHAVSDTILHVDFHQVDLHEKVTASVPIKMVGESPAEKEKLGILVQQLREIEVEALPTDMPESFEIDASVLVEVNQAIVVRDVKVSAKVKVLTDPEQIVAKIEHMAKEEVKEEVPVVPEVPASSDQPPVPVVETPAPSA